MGRNLTIYFDDESLEYIEHLEGRGTLINDLIHENFRNDEENLKKRLDKADKEKAEILRKLTDLQNKKFEKQSLESQKIKEELQERDFVDLKAKQLIKQIISKMPKEPKSVEDVVVFVKKHLPHLETEIDVSWHKAFRSLKNETNNTL